MWFFIENQDSLITQDINLEFQRLAQQVLNSLTTIREDLYTIQQNLINFVLPQFKPIDYIDDILSASSLDQMREHFISGRIKDFFNKIVSLII